jgi:leucyl-tRNA synthetase
MIRLGGRAMSKSRGNVVSPDVYFARVGADALRLFHLFAGPPEDDIDWSDQTEEIIDGCSRYLARVWRLASGEVEAAAGADGTSAADRQARADELRRAVHRSIARVTSDVERFAFNTAVATCMELTNTIYHHVHQGADRAEADEAIDVLLRLLAPMVPHLAAEAWSVRRDGHVHSQPWPVADPELLRQATVTMIVQVDGKVRDKIEVGAAVTAAEAQALALASPKVQEWLSGNRPSRIITRQPKLVSIVS